LAENLRPRPHLDSDTRPFWEGTREGELRLQRCRACANVIFYPRSVCPRCMSDDIEWFAASGRGSIHSFVVVHRAPPGFQDDVPYVVALIDLAEGPRMMSRITGADPASVDVGQSVTVVFESFDEEITLPLFRQS
jgi:uncharacterized OB-fold protein